VTVPVQNPIISYQGNGVTTLFPFPFAILESADIKVLLDGVLQAIGSQISVNGIGVSSGGSVVFTTAPTGKVIIYRDISIERDTDYQDNGDLLAVTVNADFDRIWMALQDVSGAGKRAIQYPVTEYAVDGTLPPSTERAGMLLGFDANGIQEMVPIPASIGAGDMRFEKGSDGNPGFKAGTDFTPDVTSSLTLSRAPISAANCWAYWDATPQLDFSLNGTTLTFPTPIPTGISRVYVRTGTTLSVGQPPQQSVGDAELVWGFGLRRNFTSIAKLQANADPRFQSCFVTGYYNSLDGGGGPYEVDASDTTSTDNGGSIIVDALGRRWKLNTPPDWYVEQFGGGGIGGGADDAVYTQKAINALPARGGTVRLMGKQYNWATPVTIGTGNAGSIQSTKNGVKLIGMGGGFGAATPPATNIQASAAMSGAMLRVTGAISDVHLEGFKLFAGLLAEGCLFLTASCGTQIRNVSGNQYTKFGMWWQGGAAPTGNYNVNNQINNCFFASTANGHTGLFMDGVASVFNDTWLSSFNDCRFDTTSAINSNAGYFAFVDNVSFNRCHFVGNNVVGVGQPGCFGAYFNAVGNDSFPSGLQFSHCSILSTFVNETTDKIGINTFEGYGTYDNEAIPTHPKLMGYTDKGIRFNGWGA
jgi:hypothetical protein